MPEILITVRNKLPMLAGSVAGIVANNSDYTVRFDFDEQWESGEKTVYFVRSGGFVYPPETTENDTVKVPVQRDVKLMTKLLIGVQQGDIKTSLACAVPVYASITDAIDDEALPPEPGLWDMVLKRLEEVEDSVIAVSSVNGQTGDVLLNAESVGARPDTWTPTAEEVGALPAGTAIPEKVSDLQNDLGFVTITVSKLINYYLKTEVYNKNEAYSRTEVDNVISGIDRRLNAIADSSDIDLDQLSEIVAYIKSNRDLIGAITTLKVSISDIIDNLTTGDSKKPLSAAQGKKLAEMYNALPAWAKADEKPTYTKSEIGLGNVDNVKQYSEQNPPPYPVTSVNGHTGDVQLKAGDVGAAGDEQVKQLEVKVDDNTARITALEQKKVTAPYYVDDSVAYSKDVPVNALPSAEVNKIGGMTRKCTNLFNFSMTLTSWNGLTLTYSDGGVTLNGTATVAGYLDLCTYGGKVFDGTYYSSIGDILLPTGCTIYSVAGDTRINWSGTTVTKKFVSITAQTVNSIRMWVEAGTVFSNYTLKPFIAKSETALPYEPYFDGLRSAPVTDVVSVGANLYGGGDLSFTKSLIVPLATPLKPGTYSMRVLITSSDTDKASTNADFLDANKKFISDVRFSRDVYSSAKGTIDRECHYIQFKASTTLSNSDGDTATWTDIMLNEGESVLAYEPYRSDNIPIPAAVQALDGYGWGLDDKRYNYVDLEKKQFVKWVERVDLGDRNWSKSTSGVEFVYISKFSDMAAPTSVELRKKGFLSSRYVPSTNVASTDMDDMSMTRSSDKYIVVKDSHFADASALKEGLSGEMLYYELAEPVITDISDMLTEDNYIPVGAGGTLTMVNEYGYDVPSEVTFARLTLE